MSQDPPDWAKDLVHEVKTLRDDMKEQRDDMKTQKDDMKTLRDDMKTLTTKVSEIEVQTVKNCGKLDYVQAQLKDLATQEQVDDVQKHLTNLQNTAATQKQIDGLHREINSLKDAKDP